MIGTEVVYGHASGQRGFVEFVGYAVGPVLNPPIANLHIEQPVAVGVQRASP